MKDRLITYFIGLFCGIGLSATIITFIKWLMQ